jgi:hypothetical protein
MRAKGGGLYEKEGREEKRLSFLTLSLSSLRPNVPPSANVNQRRKNEGENARQKYLLAATLAVSTASSIAVENIHTRTRRVNIEGEKVNIVFPKSAAPIEERKWRIHYLEVFIFALGASFFSFSSVSQIFFAQFRGEG